MSLMFLHGQCAGLSKERWASDLRCSIKYWNGIWVGVLSWVEEERGLRITWVLILKSRHEQTVVTGDGDGGGKRIEMG